MKVKNNSVISGITAIIVLTAVSYFPIFSAGFTNWDDQLYVLENQFVRELSVQNVFIFFKDFFVGNYHPFTMISLSVDYSLSGLSPHWYHIHNLLLHLVNTLLVYFVIRFLAKNQFIALLTALMFGVHSMHVESVAWISERKDVLYTMYFLLAAIFYMKYIAAIKGNKKNRWFYILALVFFMGSLFSKGQAVSLSLVIILIDYYQGRNLKTASAWIDKLPFLILSLIFGVIALYAQKSAAAFPDSNSFNLLESLVLSAYNISTYIAKLFLPLNLSAFYPLPDKSGGQLPLVFWGYLPVIFALAIIVFYTWKRNREVAFSILFFMVNIALVLQVIPVGGARIADRYVYIASIGLFFLVAYGINRIREKQVLKNFRFYELLMILFFCWIAFLSVSTYQRSKVWNNSLVLWSDVINKFPGTQRAHINRGNALFEQGRLTESIKDYNIVLSKNPTDVTAYINRGRAKANTGDLQGAISDFVVCTRLSPHDYLPYYNLGILYAITGNRLQAYEAFTASIQNNKVQAEAYLYRGRIGIELGYKDQACIDFRHALNLGFQDANLEIQKYCK